MENNGEIYCLTSPSGKKYVGQCVKQLSSGKKWGYIQRWKDHIRDANSKNYCRQLNNAINKYGSENFTIEVIKECNINELNYYEEHYIKLYNTLSPNGYNLTSGGSVCRQSEETQILKRKSMIGKNVGKILPKRPRLREEDNALPKYVRYYIDHSGKEGYRVSNHPLLKEKSFLSKKLPLEIKLELALKYLNQQTELI
jgi:group I intron endonuclease